jgi:hypothetical protein
MIQRWTAAAATLLLLGGQLPVFALLPLVWGEVLERILFFRAVDAPKMPGVSPAAVPPRSH